MKNGRSRAPRMLIEGVDPDEVVRLQREVSLGNLKPAVDFDQLPH
jgi:hypothetical protein